MYEGIEDIYKLLDAGRLKEALTQLQAISMQCNQWELRNRIENTLTSYGYMLQYAGMGMDDPTRNVFYRQTLHTAYELTDATNIALLSLKTSGMFYDRIRIFANQSPKTYAELQMQLETYTEDISTAPLLFHDQKRLSEEMEKICKVHDKALGELFDKTWATPFWSEADVREANELLQSVLVSVNDLAIMTSAATMSLLRIFDVQKFKFLLNAYQHEDSLVNQRAIVGLVIALCKHSKRIENYPDIVSRLSLLTEEERFQKNLYTIQMQLLITRETSKISKKMREEIIPEMLKTSKHLNDPKFRFEDIEEFEDRNPEWKEWIDTSGITDKIKEMGEWEMSGADLYLSTFSQLKHYPFFQQIHNWFCPFDVNFPKFASIKKEFGADSMSPFRLITRAKHICNSDKFSFCLALLEMKGTIKKMAIHNKEIKDRLSENELKEFEELQNKKEEDAVISRQYIQDLYRFFKLWKCHKEEEDIFQWKFDLWKNPILGHVLQQEETIKELADYLLQKEYLEEAYSLYQKLMDAHIPIAEVYQKAGYILQMQKKYREAIQHYEHADIFMPDNIWTNKHLAQCHKLCGQTTQALEYYRKVEAVQPDNLNIALQIGQCLARTENYTDALAYFYKVEYLEKNPDNARRAIAWCSFVCGKYEEALKYYQLLLQQPSPKAHDWMNTGHVYFATHQIKAAIEHYQKAQAFEQNHSAFIEKFNKDKKTLLAQGLTQEDIKIMLDLLV